MRRPDQTAAKRIWITRAQPEAEATAERIRALGYEPVVAPVIEVQPAGDVPSLEGIDALAFTSRNGVRAFAALSPERGLPVFTVGDATAEAAQEAGFGDVASASGDLAALGRLIASRRGGLKGTVLYAAPEEPAGDLVGALAEQGVQARSKVVYRTAPAAFSPPPDIFAVLVHSAKAARRLADASAWGEDGPHMSAICISPAAAEPLRGAGFIEVLVAPTADERALLEELRGSVARQGRPLLFTALFWIAIAFWLACVIGAIVVAGVGPRLLWPASIGQGPHTAQPLQFRGKSG